MMELLKYLECVEDNRQKGKIKHKASDCIAITLFAMLANANEWTEIHAFAEMNEDFLRQYLELPNGIPSHDTIQRVMAMVKPQFLQNMQLLWKEMMSAGEGEKLKKLLNIDGKTICVLNHFSHNGQVTYADLEKEAVQQGYVVSYDGMEIETQ